MTYFDIMLLFTMLYYLNRCLMNSVLDSPSTAALILTAVLRSSLPFMPVLISQLCLLLTTQGDIKQQSYSTEHMLVKAATAKCISLP